MTLAGQVDTQQASPAGADVGVLWLAGAPEDACSGPQRTELGYATGTAPGEVDAACTEACGSFYLEDRATIEAWEDCQRACGVEVHAGSIVSYRVSGSGVPAEWCAALAARRLRDARADGCRRRHRIPRPRLEVLALEPGRYFVRGRAQDHLLEGSVGLGAGERRQLSDQGARSSFAFSARRVYDVPAASLGVGVSAGVDWLHQSFETDGRAPSRDSPAGEIGALAPRCGRQPSPARVRLGPAAGRRQAFLSCSSPRAPYLVWVRLRAWRRSSMSEAKTYSGSCHCGKVKFEATTDLKTVIQCNCSICARLGYMLTFMPPEQFKLLSGESELKDYQFNKKNIHHLFCSNCGIHGFGKGKGPDGKQMYAVNLRCLEGVDLGAVKATPFDGKSM